MHSMRCCSGMSTPGTHMSDLTGMHARQPAAGPRVGPGTSRAWRGQTEVRDSCFGDPAAGQGVPGVWGAAARRFK